MSIPLICPQCGKRGKVRDEKAGGQVRCSGCGATVHVPAPSRGARADPPGAGGQTSQEWQDPSTPWRPPPTRLLVRVAVAVAGVLGLVAVVFVVEGIGTSRVRKNDLTAGAARGDKQAQYDLAMMYYTGEGLGVLRDVDLAFATFTTAAKRGHREAQFVLAHMHEWGEAEPANPEQARRWYGQSAQRGHAGALQKYREIGDEGDVIAQIVLGQIYDLGKGVPVDYAEAATWYRRAAEQGAAAAQYALGIMYVEGKGVQQDPAEAVTWLRRAGDQRNVLAQYQLGRLYSGGRGIPRNAGEAVAWYTQAAEARHLDAQMAVAELYYEGDGVQQDYAAALRWLTAAAKRNHTEAQFRAGGMHYNGQGTPRDFARALGYFQRAALQKHALAAYAAGVMYANAPGVAPRNLMEQLAPSTKEAGYWLSLSAQLGGWEKPEVLVDRKNKEAYVFVPDQGLIVRNSKARRKYPPPG